MAEPVESRASKQVPQGARLISALVGGSGVLALAVVLTFNAIGGSEGDGSNDSGGSVIAWETIQSVQRTRTESVETGVCQGQVGSLGTCYGSTKQFRQVPYTSREPGYVCAESLEAARVLVSAETTLTGRKLPDQACPDD